MRSTSGGVQAITQAGSWSAGAAREFLSVLGAGDAQVLSGTADAVSFPGTTVINSTAANACTLVAPIAGPQTGGGDDGKTIEIFSATAFAHTITTPASAILSGKHLLTFAATAGANVTLQAWNGFWLVQGTPNGVTVS